MSYVRDVEPDHFNTCNNLAGTCLHCCICHATLQFTNDDPNQCREYSRSQLILPCGTQYKEQLFPKILKLQNHWGLLTDPTNKEPFPMELVGDFRATDPIFKGCFSYSLLYTDRELGRLRWHGIHLPPYQGEIPTPLAPSYLQARQPKVMKWSPPRAATPNPSVESPKTKCSGGKGRPHCSLGCSSNTSTLECPDSTSAKKPSSPRGRPQTSRRSLPGFAAVTSMAIPLPHPLSQSDANEKMSTQKTPAHSTQPFPSVPAPLTASTVQWDPTAM